jgi:hypothetical protein
LAALGRVGNLELVASLNKSGELSRLDDLRGVQCHELNLWGNPRVTDLSPLADTDVKILIITDTSVTDISVLKELALTEIRLTYNPLRDREVLRSMGTLRKINYKTAAEFWKEVEPAP